MKRQLYILIDLKNKTKWILLVIVMYDQIRNTLIKSGYFGLRLFLFSELLFFYFIFYHVSKIHDEASQFACLVISFNAIKNLAMTD